MKKILKVNHSEKDYLEIISLISKGGEATFRKKGVRGRQQKNTSDVKTVTKKILSGDDVSYVTLKKDNNTSEKFVFTPVTTEVIKEGKNLKWNKNKKHKKEITNDSPIIEKEFEIIDVEPKREGLEVEVEPKREELEVSQTKLSQSPESIIPQKVKEKQKDVF